MAEYNKFNCFIEDLTEKKHNLASDTLKVAFSNASNPPSADDVKLADITTIDTSNFDSITLTVLSSGQMAGVYKLVLDDKVLTALGDIPALRYAIIYNDTALNDELIAWFDRGSEAELHSPDTIKLDFGAELLSLA